MRIKLLTDSHGRGLAEEVYSRCVHTFTSIVNPGAFFHQVTSELSITTAKYHDTNVIQLGTNDIPVFLAGTNDVAKNETRGLLSSLKKKLCLLRDARQIGVLSVPRRYDLPNWSIINKEVDIANNEMRKICKKLKNVTFLDISNLGRRLHTENGLHLKKLGKIYVSEKIVSLASSCTPINQSRLEPIPLQFHIDENNFLV